MPSFHNDCNNNSASNVGGKQSHPPWAWEKCLKLLLGRGKVHATAMFDLQGRLVSSSSGSDFRSVTLFESQGLVRVASSWHNPVSFRMTFGGTLFTCLQNRNVQHAVVGVADDLVLTALHILAPSSVIQALQRHTEEQSLALQPSGTKACVAQKAKEDGEEDFKDDKVDEDRDEKDEEEGEEDEESSNDDNSEEVDNEDEEEEKWDEHDNVADHLNYERHRSQSSNNKSPICKQINYSPQTIQINQTQITSKRCSNSKDNNSFDTDTDSDGSSSMGDSISSQDSSLQDSSSTYVRESSPLYREAAATDEDSQEVLLVGLAPRDAPGSCLYEMTEFARYLQKRLTSSHVKSAPQQCVHGAAYAPGYNNNNNADFHCSNPAVVSKVDPGRGTT